MTGVLWFLVIAALLTLAGVVWLEHRRHQADEQAYEDELNQQFGGNSETTETETAVLLPLPAEDLVGPLDSDADPAGDWPAAGADASGVEDDRARAQDVHGAEPSGRGAVAVTAPRMTAAQRRRAVKKGRIPRNVPAVVGRLGDTGHHGGALNLPSLDARDDRACAAAGRGAGEFHPHAERIPPPLEVWDPLMRAWMPVFPTLLESARHEAHFRQWESELGSLIDGAYAWLEAAA